MSKDKLPITRDSDNAVARQLDDTTRAKKVRNPFSAFFRGIGDSSEEQALKGSTVVANATVENIDAQNSVVRAIMRMRDTVDDYQARDEKAPEYYADAVGRHEDALSDNAHKRELARKRRVQEQIEADRGVFNADQGLGKLKTVRTFKEELWSADAYSARTEATIRAAEFRAAETSPIIDVTPEPAPAISPLAALEQQEVELQEQLNEAIADGRWDDVRSTNADLEALRRTISLMKKAPGAARA